MGWVWMYEIPSLRSPQNTDIDSIYTSLYNVILIWKERVMKMITVRVPETLHGELLEEAKREGVSLNQLCLTKLARPLDWYRQKTPEKEERKK